MSSNGPALTLIAIIMVIVNHSVSMFILVSVIRHLHHLFANLIYAYIAHLTTFPGLEDPSAMKQGVVEVIKEITSKPDVWVVTNAQLLQWVSL